MHPVEAVSILSQLSYLTHTHASTFAKEYAATNAAHVPVFAPVVNYVPLFPEFTYASNRHIEPDTPIVYTAQSTTLAFTYYKHKVGRQSTYRRTLFLMSRDADVLDVLVLAKNNVNFYCIRNGNPVESLLDVAAFRKSYNTDTVYPCKGQLHDDYVPLCKCPPPPQPPSQLLALRKKIEALREAAPFAIRLQDLYEKVARAHSTASNLEQGAFPIGTMLANFTFETWDDLGVNPIDFPTGSIADLKSLPYLDTYRRKLHALALDARSVADAAETELAAYVTKKEDAAFAAFKPYVRSLLSQARTNDIDGYATPEPSLHLRDLSPLYTDVNPPDNQQNPNGGVLINNDDGLWYWL